MCIRDSTAAKEAIDAGVNVVAGFTPLGSDFTTLDPQVPGPVSYTHLTLPTSDLV